MKHIYNRTTGLLESVVDINENAIIRSFDDVIENARELHTDNEVIRVVDNLVAGKGNNIIVLAQSRGNGIVDTLETVCEDKGYTANILSGRNLISVDDVYDALADDVDLFIIDEFSFIRNIQVMSAVFAELLENGIKAILVANIDSAGNDNLVRVANGRCIYFVYSPVNDAISYYDDDDDMNESIKESVAERFAKYRKLYEEEDLSEDDANAEGGEENKEGDDANAEGGEENKEGDDANAEGGEENKEGDDEEDVPLTAIVITVKKGSEDKCKEELIDAGIGEDAIDILDAEEDAENVDIKIDAEFIDELDKYLEGKGISLEEKLGGSWKEEGDEGEKSEEGENGSDESGKDDGEENQSFDDAFGDLFTDEDNANSEEPTK